VRCVPRCTEVGSLEKWIEPLPSDVRPLSESVKDLETIVEHRSHRYFDEDVEQKEGTEGKSGKYTALRGPPMLRYNGQLMAGGLA